MRYTGQRGRQKGGRQGGYMGGGGAARPQTSAPRRAQPPPLPQQRGGYLYDRAVRPRSQRGASPPPPARGAPPPPQQQMRPRIGGGGYLSSASPRPPPISTSSSAYAPAPARPSSLILTPLNIPRRTPRPLPSIDTLTSSTGTGGRTLSSVTPTAGGLLQRRERKETTDGGAPESNLPAKETILQCMDKIDLDLDGALDELEDAKKELEQVKRKQAKRAREKKKRQLEIEARRSSITELPPTLFLEEWAVLTSKSCASAVSAVYAENAHTLLTAAVHDETAAMIVRNAEGGRLLERVIAASTLLCESTTAEPEKARTRVEEETQWWETDASAQRHAREVRRIAMQLRDGHSAVPLRGGRSGARWVPLASAPLLSAAHKIDLSRRAFAAAAAAATAAAAAVDAKPMEVEATAGAAESLQLPSRRHLAREMLTLGLATSCAPPEVPRLVETAAWRTDAAMHAKQRDAVKRVIAQRRKQAWDEEQRLVSEFIRIRGKWETQRLSGSRGGRSRLRAGVGRRQSRSSAEMLLETHRHAEAALADEQESLRLAKQASIASAAAEEAASALAASNSNDGDPTLKGVAIATAAAAAAFEAAAKATGHAGSSGGKTPTGGARGPRSRLLNRLGIGSTSIDATSELVAAAKKEEQAWKKRLLGAISEQKIPPMELSRGRIWPRHPICFSLVPEPIDCRNLPLDQRCPPRCSCPKSAAAEDRRCAEWSDIEKCIFIDKFMQCVCLLSPACVSAVLFIVLMHSARRLFSSSPLPLRYAYKRRRPSSSSRSPPPLSAHTHIHKGFQKTFRASQSFL